jgi:hypothetical protein
VTKSGKGSAFERDICKELSLWWSEGETDDVFWRTSGSGARATSRSRVGKSTFGQYGDIQATDPDGQPFLNWVTIELKRGYGKWSILDCVDKREGAAVQEVEKFIEQAETQCREAGTRWPVLIFRRDRRKPIIVLPRSLYEAAKRYHGGTTAEMHRHIILRLGMGMEEYCFFVLGAFLDFCEPDFFLELDGGSIDAEGNPVSQL